MNRIQALSKGVAVLTETTKEETSQVPTSPKLSEIPDVESINASQVSAFSALSQLDEETKCQVLEIKLRNMREKYAKALAKLRQAGFSDKIY